ncbi:hypothetical protein HZU73_00570 [Apis mellifera caucasica]|nr:hypothetical protein HZU73_00570 [Apis mellifera caucasica]
MLLFEVEVSRAAKWTWRKGASKGEPPPPPSQEEEEEEEEGEEEEEEDDDDDDDEEDEDKGEERRGEESGKGYNTILSLPFTSAILRLTHLSAGNLLVALGYHSAATTGATLRLPTSGPPAFPRGAVTPVQPSPLKDTFQPTIEPSFPARLFPRPFVSSFSNPSPSILLIDELVRLL